MNREQAKELLPVLAAFADGKTIEYRPRNQPDRPWLATDNPGMFDTDIYRIKPEARLRPWTAEEAPKYFMSRLKASREVPTALYCDENVMVDSNGCNYGLGWLCENAVRVAEDGSESPCGIVEDAP